MTGAAGDARRRAGCTAQNEYQEVFGMKLTFWKHIYPESDTVVAYPRIEVTSEELAAGAEDVEVSLSRVPGGCVFRLGDLQEHDSHAPAWRLDGKAPLSSTDPAATIYGYMDRIADEIRSHGFGVDVEVVSVVHQAGGDGDDGDGDGGAGGDDWEKYGIVG